jgi:hypothetical protein
MLRTSKESRLSPLSKELVETRELTRSCQSLAYMSYGLRCAIWKRECGACFALSESGINKVVGVHRSNKSHALSLRTQIICSCRSKLPKLWPSKKFVLRKCSRSHQIARLGHQLKKRSSESPTPKMRRPSLQSLNIHFCCKLM